MTPLGIPQAPIANSSGSEPRNPPGSHSMNENGEIDCSALRETVRRLSFWIMQITGAIDLGENPDHVSFPNTRTCRDLVKLKKDVEALQQKCEECQSKTTGGDSKRISSLEKTTETLRIGSISELSEEGTLTVRRVAQEG